MNCADNIINVQTLILTRFHIVHTSLTHVYLTTHFHLLYGHRTAIIATHIIFSCPRLATFRFSLDNMPYCRIITIALISLRDTWMKSKKVSLRPISHLSPIKSRVNWAPSLNRPVVIFYRTRVYSAIPLQNTRECNVRHLIIYIE